MSNITHPTAWTASPSSNAATQYPDYIIFWLSSNMDGYRYSLFILIMIVSIAGNLSVISSIVALKLQSEALSALMLNISLSDMMVTLICMPLHLAGWQRSRVMLDPVVCMVAPFLQGTSVFCSVYTLIVISIKRYASATQPISFGVRTQVRKFRTGLAISLIWVASMTTVSPSLAVYRVGTQPNGKKRCDEYGWSRKDSQIFTYVLLTIGYVFPLALLSVCYAKIGHKVWFCKIPGINHMLPKYRKIAAKKLKERKKSVILCAVYVIAFMLCHLPINAITFLWYVGKDLEWIPPAYMPIIAFHAEAVLYANSAVNPLMYGVLHRKLQHNIRRAIFSKILSRRTEQTTRDQFRRMIATPIAMRDRRIVNAHHLFDEARYPQLANPYCEVIPLRVMYRPLS